MSTLPRPYQLLSEIAEYANLVEDGDYRSSNGTQILGLVQELAQELWRAGQSERHAGMGTNDNDHDAPLWCGGMFIHQVTAAVGVPTLLPSDPARDLGRGKSYR